MRAAILAVLLAGCRDRAPAPRAHDAPPLRPPDAAVAPDAAVVEWRLANVSADGKQALLVASAQARVIDIDSKQLVREGSTDALAADFPLASTRYGVRLPPSDPLAQRIERLAPGFVGTWAYAAKTNTLRVVVGAKPCVLDIPLDKPRIAKRACIADEATVKLSPSGDYAAWTSKRRTYAMQVATKRITVDIDYDGDIQISDHGYLTITVQEGSGIWYPDERDFKRSPRLDPACRFRPQAKNLMLCVENDGVKQWAL